MSTVFLVNNSMANPTISVKYGWFGMTLILAIISCLILFSLNKVKTKSSIIDYLISIFCFWGISFTYFTNNTFSFKLNILLLLWAFYIICRITIEQYKNSLPILLLTLLITGLIEAVWGLGQLYGYFLSQHNLFKITGSFYNPGPYAGYLSLILPISLYYLLFDYSIIRKQFEYNKLLPYIRWGISLLTLISIILILPSTMSRASWISAFVGCFFIIYVYIFKKRELLNSHYFQRNKKKALLVFSVVLVILATTIWEVYHLNQDSADGRFLIWKNSITIIRNNPLGVGVGHFPGIYGEVQANYFATQNTSKQEQFVAGSPEYAFNEYLQIGIEFGLIPLVLFVLIIILAIYIGYKKRHYPVVAGLLSLFSFASLSYPFNLLSFLIVLIILIALSVSSYKSQKIKEFPKIYHMLTMYSILTITGIIIYQNHALMEAYKTWNRVKILRDTGIDEKQAIEYKRLHIHLKHEATFLFEYAQCLNKLEHYNESNRILNEMINISCDPMIYNVMGRNYQAMNNYYEAEKAFKRASLLVPSRLYPYYLLTKLYDKIGDSEKTMSMAAIVLTKDAKIHSEAIIEMRKEVQEIYNNHEEAMLK